MKKFKSGTSILALIAAYNSGTPGWKKDDNGNIVVKDGNPVYLTTSGQEQTVDGTTISAKNAEAKQHRERAEAAEAKLKTFEGIDPEIARKAIETVQKIDAKTLIDAGKVDEVKKQITDQFTAQLTEKDSALRTALNQIDDMKISGIFKDSDFLREGIAVPRDFVESAYRSNFKIENGKVVAYDKAGNQIMSKERLGELASPDEALRLLVESRADKDLIIKADVGNGSGNGGGSGVRGQGNVIKRSEFDKMDANKKAEVAGKQLTGEIKIVD